MLSLIGLDLKGVRKVCAKSNTEIANLNCPGQTVISGGVSEIAEAEKVAKELGVKKAVLLEVSGGFHSSLMQGASVKLARELEKIQIHSPKIKVLSNVTARPTTDPVEIKDNLIKQVASSVLWDDSMKFILSKGIKNFIEFGPGKVLKGLMRRIDERAEVINIDKKGDILGFAAS
jgi:[acyl-carrier-protein] S-malonyltransferase